MIKVAFVLVIGLLSFPAIASPFDNDCRVERALTTRGSVFLVPHCNGVTRILPERLSAGDIVGSYDSLFFEENEIELSIRSKTILDTVVANLIEIEDLSLAIVSHVLVGDNKVAISLDNAVRVKEYIISKGVDELRITISAGGDSGVMGVYFEGSPFLISADLLYRWD